MELPLKCRCQMFLACLCFLRLFVYPGISAPTKTVIPSNSRVHDIPDYQKSSGERTGRRSRGRKVLQQFPLAGDLISVCSCALLGALFSVFCPSVVLDTRWESPNCVGQEGHLKAQSHLSSCSEQGQLGQTARVWPYKGGVTPNTDRLRNEVAV